MFHRVCGIVLGSELQPTPLYLEYPLKSSWACWRSWHRHRLKPRWNCAWVTRVCALRSSKFGDKDARCPCSIPVAPLIYQSWLLEHGNSAWKKTNQLSLQKGSKGSDMVTPSVLWRWPCCYNFYFKGYTQHTVRFYNPMSKLHWNISETCVTMLQTCLIWDRDILRHRECPAAQLPQVHSDTQEGPPCWASQLAVTSGDGIWDCKQVRSYGVQTCTNMLQTLSFGLISPRPVTVQKWFCI